MDLVRGISMTLITFHASIVSVSVGMTVLTETTCNDRLIQREIVYPAHIMAGQIDTAWVGCPRGMVLDVLQPSIGEWECRAGVLVAIAAVGASPWICSQLRSVLTIVGDER